MGDFTDDEVDTIAVINYGDCYDLKCFYSHYRWNQSHFTWNHGLTPCLDSHSNHVWRERHFHYHRDSLLLEQAARRTLKKSVPHMTLFSYDCGPAWQGFSARSIRSSAHVLSLLRRVPDIT